MTYALNQLYSVPLAELWPDPLQPQKYLISFALADRKLVMAAMTSLPNAINTASAGAAQ